MAKLGFRKNPAAFRARKGKQGIGGWTAEDHARHMQGLRPRRGGKFAAQINKGGF